MSERSPITIVPIPSSTHRSTMCFESVLEVVGATLRFLVVQPGSLLGVRIVTASDPLAEVVVVLFQAVERVQLAVTVFVGECGEVSDAEINAHRLFTRGFRHIDLDFTHEVQLPLSPVQTARTCRTFSTLERSTSGRIWYLQRVKSDQYAFRLEPFESRTRLYWVSSLKPAALNVTVERGWSSPCFR